MQATIKVITEALDRVFLWLLAGLNGVGQMIVCLSIFG